MPRGPMSEEQKEHLRQKARERKEAAQALASATPEVSQNNPLIEAPEPSLADLITDIQTC